MAGAHFSFRLKKGATEHAARKAGLRQSLPNTLILTCLALESDSSNGFHEIKEKSGLTSTLPPAFGCLARLTPIHSSSLSSRQVFPQSVPLELPTERSERQQGKETWVLNTNQRIPTRKEIAHQTSAWQCFSFPFHPDLFEFLYAFWVLVWINQGDALTLTRHHTNAY